MVSSVDIDGDYTETLARIDTNTDGIGVFGLAFYENNTDKLKVATMSVCIAPSTETIASGEYPVSRPLFFYVKKAHIGVIPGLKEYAQFFVADEIAGGSTARWRTTAWLLTPHWQTPSPKLQTKKPCNWFSGAQLDA